jgi:hypothetical protein
MSRWPLSMWPILLVFVGALIAAIGNAFTKEGLPRYVILIGTTLVAIGGMWYAVNQVSYNIGGDSFIYLAPGFKSSAARSTGIVDIDLRHQGIYPVYDTYIRIVDLEKAHEAGKEPHGLDKYSAQYEHYRNFDRLDPNRVVINFERWQLPRDADQQGYNIFFSSRNGDFVQSFRFRRINGEWMVSMQVTRLGGGQTFLEQGLEFLPRDKNGQPKW